VTIRLFERLPLRLHGFLPCFPLFLGCFLVRLPGLARIRNFLFDFKNGSQGSDIAFVSVS
jgi:hypothetical protein